MYGLLIDGVEIIPPEQINFIGEIKLWEKIVRAAATIASPGSKVDAVRLSSDWLTKNLPQTNPPASTRPGAEYGVDV